MTSRTTIAAFAVALAACFNLAGAAAQGTPDYAALIAAPDRSAADRATDARRDPLKALAFIGAPMTHEPAGAAGQRTGGRQKRQTSRRRHCRDPVPLQPHPR